MAEKVLIIPKEEVAFLASKFETPFYLYDEDKIRSNCWKLKSAFSWASGFKNYFAVKACPNPTILEVIRNEGFGVDCSSLAELVLAESCGFKGNEMFFTSNNTPLHEFRKAKECGAILNLDDISHIDFVHEKLGLPAFLCFRYNPGELRSGNSIIGEPKNSKFGMTRNQIFQALEISKALGVEKFALHTMVLSNCMDEDEILKNAKMMFDLVEEIYKKIGISISMVNLGGGIGIPYLPEEKEFKIELLGEGVKQLYENLMLNNNGMASFELAFECGRYITGNAGILVSRIIHQKNTYKKFIGVDACMANLMRPAIYGAYHHITLIKESDPLVLQNLPSKRCLFNDNYAGQKGVYDIIGSLCENNDKFGIDRFLGCNVEIGDLLVIHDTGAHGHCMGFNYNGKLKSAEYLRKSSGQLICIRRKEDLSDYFSTTSSIKSSFNYL